MYTRTWADYGKIKFIFGCDIYKIYPFGLVHAHL